MKYHRIGPVIFQQNQSTSRYRHHGNEAKPFSQDRILLKELFYAASDLGYVSFWWGVERSFLARTTLTPCIRDLGAKVGTLLHAVDHGLLRPSLNKLLTSGVLTARTRIEQLA
ncbi:hypothetical protein HPP92_028967, partial [Vanilla planifolia]